VANRVYENTVINHACQQNYHEFAPIKLHEYVAGPVVTDDNALVRVPFHVKYEFNSSGLSVAKTHWKRSSYRNHKKYTVPASFTTALAGHLANFRSILDHDDSFVLDCFSEYKNKGFLYRTSEYYRGTPWIDWCLIYFDESGPFEAGMYPCKIINFFKFPAGIPSPSFVDLHFSGVDMDSIGNMVSDNQEYYCSLLQGYKDESVYVCVDSATTPIKDDVLRTKFYGSFSLGNEEGLYLLNADKIAKPFYAIRDFGDKKSKKHYTILPYGEWGTHFAMKCMGGK